MWVGEGEMELGERVMVWIFVEFVDRDREVVVIDGRVRGIGWRRWIVGVMRRWVVVGMIEIIVGRWR